MKKGNPIYLIAIFIFVVNLFVNKRQFTEFETDNHYFSVLTFLIFAVALAWDLVKNKWGNTGR